MSKDWHVMSEDDIRVDRKLVRNLYEAKYQVWKRHNIQELHEVFSEEMRRESDFEKFCRKLFFKHRNP